MRPLLIGLTLVLASVGSGWLAWFSARWLVGRDDLHGRLHDFGLGLVADGAEMLFSIGLIPTLFCALLFGILAATWLAFGRYQPNNDEGRKEPATPLFELFVGNEKMALLYEPKRDEMFWCSYRLEPVSEAADRVLRDEAIWNEVRFTVKARDGRIQDTFTGGDFIPFCRRETNRLSFRSLWPINA